MILSFGMYQNEILEIMFLKDPDYFAWMLWQEEPMGTFKAACDKAKQLIAIFDGKPLDRTCHGEDCDNFATRGSVFRSRNRLIDTNPLWWCDYCDPFDQIDCSPGDLELMRNYEDVIYCAEMFSESRSRKSNGKRLMQQLALAKGLPEKATNLEIFEFFYTPLALAA